MLDLEVRKGYVTQNTKKCCAKTWSNSNHLQHNATPYNIGQTVATLRHNKVT